MNNSGQNRQRNADLQVAAIIASLTVMTGFALYWWGQIQSVRELLEMAYG